MKGKMHVYYDEEGDFLEINVGRYTKGYFRDVGKGIVKRIDEKTGKVTGIGILSFRKRVGTIKNLDFNLPVKLEIQ